MRSSQMGSMLEGDADPKWVGREADVDAILTGTLLESGIGFGSTCQLVEAPGGTVIWSDMASSTLQDLFVSKLRTNRCNG